MVDDYTKTIDIIGKANLADAFAHEAREAELMKKQPDAVRMISLADDIAREDDKTLEAKAIEALPPGFKERMATMGLLGYRFYRGKFYWRCISPERTTVESLQPSLQICIAKAEEHHDQKHQTKPTPRR